MGLGDDEDGGDGGSLQAMVLVAPKDSAVVHNTLRVVVPKVRDLPQMDQVSYFVLVSLWQLLTFLS